MALGFDLVREFMSERVRLAVGMAWWDERDV